MYLPDGDGLAVLAASHTAALVTRLIFLADRLERGVVLRALRAGAAGFVAGTATLGEVQAALYAAAVGMPVLSVNAQGVLIEHILDEDELKAGTLTKREREILTLVARGKSAAQIARELYVEPTTIRTHQRRLYKKLGVLNSAAAVAEGMRRGLVE